MSVPTPCDISTLNSSPSFSVTRGLAVHPTPAGVLYISMLFLVFPSHKTCLPSDDDCTGWQCCSLRHKCDDFGNGEDKVAVISGTLRPHSRHGALLDCLSVELSADLDLCEIGDRTRRDVDRSKGVGSIEPLGEAPLALSELRDTLRNIVCRGDTAVNAYRAHKHTTHPPRYCSADSSVTSFASLPMMIASSAS